MPNTALQDAIKEAYASAPSNIAILETLEVSHSAVGTPIYLVKNRENLTFTLEDLSVVEFMGASFDLELPPSGESGIQDLNVRFDNVGDEIRDFINIVKTSTEPVVLKHRPYRSDDLTTPQMDPPLMLWLRNIRMNLLEATGRASFVDVLNRKFPAEYYTRKRFPSLGD